MPWTHCQIFVDSGNAATPFTFPAGTIVAKVKCVGRGADGNGQNGGGGGGYGEAMIESPNLGEDVYLVEFADERCAFRQNGGDLIASGANAIGVEPGGRGVLTELNVGSVTNLGGFGGTWAAGEGGSGGGGGGGCGGPDAGGVNGEQNDGLVGGSPGAANGENSHDLTEDIGDTRVWLFTDVGGRGGGGGNNGQDGNPGIFPGGGGGGAGDAPPTGPGSGAFGVVVVLYEVSSSATVQTVSATINTPSSAVAAGSYTGSPDSVGFVAGASPSPTIATARHIATATASGGTFSANVMIDRATTTYVRAFATAGSETTYGDEIQINPRPGGGLADFERLFPRRRRVFMRRIRRDAAMDGEPE